MANSSNRKGKKLKKSRSPRDSSKGSNDRYKASLDELNSIKPTLKNQKRVRQFKEHLISNAFPRSRKIHEYV